MKKTHAIQFGAAETIYLVRLPELQFRNGSGTGMAEPWNAKDRDKNLRKPVAESWTNVMKTAF